ncbi:hypothetical protein [Marmoricola sp. URHB0036]|uniref:hypothetical protein n=1 Tax=Marmoricola sp. URHB0036 TaxID=1298863 RepID=UPI0012DE4EBF|nr:hypothetical protein [Marmoricola sp. URHB0036]
MAKHTGVLLRFSDGRRQFIDDAHVHGFRDGDLLIALGPAEAGLHAVVARRVPVAELAFADTRNAYDDDGEPDTHTLNW